MILQLFGALALTILNTFNTIYNTFNEMNKNDTVIQQSDESALDLHKVPYKKAVVLGETYMNKDITLLFVAKNIDRNGEGVYYDINIAPPFSYDMGDGTYNSILADIVTQNGNTFEANRLGFVASYYETITDLGTRRDYYLTYVYLQNSAGTQKVIYVCNNTTGAFYAENAIFTVRKITATTNSLATFNLINNLFDIYDYGDSIFKFEEEFNYNAPYQTASNSTLIYYDGFPGDTVNQPQYVHKTYDLPFFFSNGQVFNQVVVHYMNAHGRQFMIDGEVTTFRGEKYGFYYNMRYINTYTGLDIAVNYRLQNTYPLASDVSLYYIDKSMWYNADFRTLSFVQELTSTQRTNLAQFNKLGGTGYTYTGTQTDIGLGNVFTLLTSAFGAVGGFLAIEVFPGLSLGLLLFAPLIVGIIIAVVWIVKR